jgi:glycosyltransferase involved in cell wall biosynthesis
LGNHTVGTWRALKRAGIGGGIWADYIHRDLLRTARTYQRYPGWRPGRRPRALLYQASTGSDGLVDFLLKRSEPMAICYHNITPPEFFDRYETLAAKRSREGREELRRLVPRTTSFIADSEFNASELRSLGAEGVAVVFPYTGSRAVTPPDPEYQRRLLGGKTGIDLLFVGRMMPNKGVLHLLRAVAALRASGDVPARLFMATLRRLHEQLGLEDTVVFTGSLPDEQLAAHYATADLFVCLSEHEGFCIPLLEAMRIGLPVVAYDAGAVSETLGGSGLLMGTLDPLLVAEAVHSLAADEGLRRQLRDRQRARAAELDGFDRDAALLAALRPVIEE